MNKKGLTLVEVIASLVVLSAIALIVTPNIYQNIVEYKDQLFEAQMNNIKEGAKSWATDNIKLLPEDDTHSLQVSVQELQEEGYIRDELKNPRDGGYFDDSTTVVIISCEQVNNNYNYTYGVYTDLTKYIEAMAIQYSKNNGNISITTTTSTLQSDGLIARELRNTSGENISIPEYTIAVEVTEENDKYIYTTTIE